MFNITKVDIIPSQMGNGLKIKDFEIGCAKIVEIQTEEGKTIEDVIFNDGLVAPISMVDTDAIYFDTKSLMGSKNYVLVTIKDGAVSTITNVKEVVELFELDSDDADMLQQYIGALALDRNLVCSLTNDLDGEDMMFFTNAFDKELTNDFINGDLDAAKVKYSNMLTSPDFRTEHTTDNFIKMFLYALITACQDRYNKTNREAAIRKAADLISSIKFWEDGQLLSPSLTDIDDYLANVKSAIRIR